MKTEYWIALAVVLILAGIVFGGVFVGLLGASASAAALQAARKKERETIEKENQIEKEKNKKVQAIEKDFKMESKVLQHKSALDLKREILNDLDDLDTRR